MNNAGTNLIGKRKKTPELNCPKIVPEQQQEAPSKNPALAIFLLRGSCSFPFWECRQRLLWAPAGISVHGCGETGSPSPWEWFLSWGTTLDPAGQPGALGLHHTHRNSLGRNSQGKGQEAAGGFSRVTFCLLMCPWIEELLRHSPF